MKNPRKTEGHISKRDYKKLIKLIDTKIEVLEDEFKYECYTHTKSHSDAQLADIDTSVILEHRYDEGYYEGAIQALNNMKWSIREMYELDQMDWKKKLKRGKKSFFYYLFYPITMWF